MTFMTTPCDESRCPRASASVVPRHALVARAGVKVTEFRTGVERRWHPRAMSLIGWPPAVAELASYENVRVPDTYWLDMVRASHGWEPARRLKMPLHHATRLELVNAADI